VSAPSYDVIVAGGGPGGSTVAGRLAQAGHRVLLLERALFPRFQLGESLLPMTLDVLDALGVTGKLDAQLIRKHGAWFVDGLTGETVCFKFAAALRAGRPHAFHGPRAEIDQILLDHAGSLGVEVRQGWQVKRLKMDGTRAVGVLASAKDGPLLEIEARMVVDATGRAALCSRAPAARTKTPGLEQTLAIYAHFDGCERMAPEDEGDIRIVLVPDGWFWVIPFRGERTSVGVVLKPSAVAGGADLDGLLRQLCEASPPMRKVMSGARQVFPARAAADFSYRVHRLCGDGWLAVGDAAGFIDPLFSTGFHLAVKGADLAASAIASALREGDVSRERFVDYEQQIKGACATYVGVVQAFYAGPLVELLFDRQKRDILRRMITSVLAGDVFHAEQPRWLREVEQRFPARLAGAKGFDEEVDLPGAIE
jgi:flavin-dependent dehydrogenase